MDEHYRKVWVQDLYKDYEKAFLIKTNYTLSNPLEKVESVYFFT